MPPKYQKIAEELRIHIQAGKFSDAHTLPTEFAIAQEYQVSRQTVRQALSLLARDGLIEKRQGSGSYIRQSPAEPPGQAKKVIAVITTYISDYIFPSILREVETVLAENNCTPSLFATRNQVYNERRILAGLLESPVDGILVEGTKSALPNPNLDLYRQLLDRNIPLVFMNGNYAGLQGAFSVLDDNYGGGRMLVEYLEKKGHRRIAGIFKSDDIQGHQRYAGYADALRDLNLPMEDWQLFWYNTESKARFLAEDLPEPLIQALGRCSAVVCYNDEIACRIEVCMMRRGVNIPQELAIVSFDNSQYSDLSSKPITSLSHGENNVGRLAAELLIRLMQGEACRSETAPWVLKEKESG
ncbi:MAG: substrate-binding domain-containing protein [Oscillibacter sp.]|nr:substrate-binding domain-containing protein [Oscillibacter sp.]